MRNSISPLGIICFSRHPNQATNRRLPAVSLDKRQERRFIDGSMKASAMGLFSAAALPRGDSWPVFLEQAYYLRFKCFISGMESVLLLVKKHFPLRDNVARINTFIYVMDRNTLGCVLKETPKVGVCASVPRQQRNMKIDHSSPQLFDNLLADDMPIPVANGEFDRVGPNNAGIYRRFPGNNRVASFLDDRRQWGISGA